MTEQTGKLDPGQVLNLLDDVIEAVKSLKTVKLTCGRRWKELKEIQVSK